MADFVGAVDQGTTSTRFMIFDHAGNEVAEHQLEHEQILPQAGWVEHNPVEIWERTGSVIRTALQPQGPAGVRPGRARHHQPARDRGGVGPEDRPAVLQRDRLAGHPDRPDRLRAGARGQGRRDPAEGRPAAGDVLLRRQDPVDPGERRRRPRGGRGAATRSSATPTPGCCGTSPAAPTAASHVTDVTNASRTMLMNLETLDWDDELLGVLQHPAVDAAGDPAVVGPEHVRRDARANGPLGGEVPLTGDLGDQQAATVGQVCFAPGEAKNTYGTGNFMLLNTGTELVRSKAGLLTTVCYKFGDADAGVRAGGLDRGHRLGGAVAARPARHHLAAPRRSRRWPGRSRTTAACTSCRRSPACSRRTGAPTPAARSSGCPGSTPTLTWPGPRWRRSATRARTSPTRWRRTPGSRSTCSRSTAA